MKQNDRREIHIRPRIVCKDDLADTVVTYGEAYGVYASIQPAGGSLQAEVYGERLSYMLELRVGNYAAVHEGDGVCVYVPPTAQPDYKVVSAAAWPKHRKILIEAGQAASSVAMSQSDTTAGP